MSRTGAGDNARVPLRARALVSRVSKGEWERMRKLVEVACRVVPSIPGIPLFIKPGQAGHFTAHHQIRNAVGQTGEHADQQRDGNRGTALIQHAVTL